MNTSESADKIALKELIDTIAFLGDKKDVESQVRLFSENAVSVTISKGKAILELQGREAMAEAFPKFLQDIEMTYHFNGQQVVRISGDTATGDFYCLITLIGNEDGKKIKTTIGATYEDEYIRSNNQWLVSKRVGYFKWVDKEEIKQ